MSDALESSVARLQQMVCHARLVRLLPCFVRGGYLWLLLGTHRLAPRQDSPSKPISACHTYAEAEMCRCCRGVAAGALLRGLGRAR